MKTIDAGFVQISKLCLAALLVVALSSACLGRQNSDVDRVQGALFDLQRDPAVQSNAVLELKEADLAVSRAITRWNANYDSEEAEHLSYLAAKRIEIARAKTDQRVAENGVVILSRARDEALTDARTQSAETGGARPSVASAVAAHYDALLEERQILIEHLKSQLDDLQARVGIRGLILTLGDDLFEPDRAELRFGAAPKLSPLITFLRQHPRESVSIEGHTDNAGSARSNIDLSTGRAEAVRRFMIERRIDSNRIGAEGLGEKNPAASNDSAAGRVENRRVEMVISSSGSMGDLERR